jgi:hypothetical protein
MANRQHLNNLSCHSFIPLGPYKPTTAIVSAPSMLYEFLYICHLVFLANDSVFFYILYYPSIESTIRANKSNSDFVNIIWLFFLKDDNVPLGGGGVCAPSKLFGESILGLASFCLYLGIASCLYKCIWLRVPFVWVFETVVIIFAGG